MTEGTKWSRLDRYFLSNQLRIMEALYPDEANDFAVRRESIEKGYEIFYEIDMSYIYGGNDKMTAEESREVWDTMDMFDAIDRALKIHGVGLAEGMPITQFRGYDGNNEAKFMSFAAFTVERLGRFKYLPMAKEGYWNSHAPSREPYSRMLSEWKEIPSPENFDLSKDQLRRVLEAAIHPDQR